MSTTNGTGTEETISRLELTSESVVILSIVSTLTSVAGSLGDALVMIAVFKSQTLRSIPDYIISSLAFSDFTVCFIYLPLMIHRYNHYTKYLTYVDSAVSIATSFFGHCSWIASVTNMFVVTIDRVIAVRFPLKYTPIMTVEKAMGATALVWIISLTFGAFYAREIGAPSKLIILSYCIILMIGTWAMYAYIFFTAKQQENKIQTLNSSAGPLVLAEQKAQKKATKTIFTVVGIYTLCWLPLLLFPIIVFSSSSKNELYKRYFPWVQTLLTINSALNPYVYCLRSRKYRYQFAKLLGIRRYQNHPVDE